MIIVKSVHTTSTISHHYNFSLSYQYNYNYNMDNKYSETCLKRPPCIKTTSL